MSTVFIGDVHGCARELDRLLRTIDWNSNKDRLLLTGDAFSRGPDPVGVWRTIDATKAEMVLGNHDANLMYLLRRAAAGERFGFANPDQATTIRQLLPFADDLLPWLETLPLYIEEEDFLLVHAGINPEGGLKATTRDEFLTIRTWPPSNGIDGPRWYDQIEPQGRILVFGHDAPGGLVCRYRPGESAQTGDSPYLVGLDSGCVYGGQLSAFWLEKRRLVQVDSENAWFSR